MLNSLLPMHPAIVHIPLGVGLFLPIAALLLFIFYRHGGVGARWMLFLGQGVVFGGALLAMETGEHDEERVESLVGEASIETHEELAEGFLGLSAGLLGLSLLGAAMYGRRGGLAIAGLGALLSAAQLGQGMRVGHAGGEIVYGKQPDSRWAGSSAGSQSSALALGFGGAGGQGAEGAEGGGNEGEEEGEEDDD